MHHHVHLANSASSDIFWWQSFVHLCTGICLLQSPPSHLQHHLQSDMLGLWGCTAIWNNHWFQVIRLCSWQATYLAIKELLTILLAASVWVRSWEVCTVLCSCECAAVVVAATSTLLIMCCLLSYTAHFRFSVTTCHIPGTVNSVADTLCCNNIHSFCSLCPQDSLHPTLVLQEPLQLVPRQQP